MDIKCKNGDICSEKFVYRYNCILFENCDLYNAACDNSSCEIEIDPGFQV